MNRMQLGGSVAALILLVGCELPRPKTVQFGFRGVGIEQGYSPEAMAKTAAANALPKVIAPAPADSLIAGKMYQNVPVLGHLSNAEFVRTMAAITDWVAPKTGPDAGCAYCHDVTNMASEVKYQKAVSRRMLQMTQNINANWTSHVVQTGVTCYTCHRGAPVPTGTWFYTDANQGLRHYLDRNDIRVQTPAALRSEVDNPASIKQTEYTYAVMLSMSGSLGVNCTYCHNSRQWSSWEESSPKRLLALRGVRMVRDLNLNYMLSLQDAWPADRHAKVHLADDGTLLNQHIAPAISRGPMGDGAKLQCSTCHQGIYKPLYGQPLASGFPGLYPAPKPVAPVADTAAVVATVTPPKP